MITGNKKPRPLDFRAFAAISVFNGLSCFSALASPWESELVLIFSSFKLISSFCPRFYPCSFLIGMKRFEAHRFHRLEALEVQAPPTVEGLTAHTMVAADVFNAHASRAISQNFLTDFVCNFHGL